MKNVSRTYLLRGLISLVILASSYRPAMAQAPPGVTFLHVFDGGASGANPVTSVIQTPDFSLAGVAFGQEQFASTGGVLYTVSPTGKFTILHQFPASGVEGNAVGGRTASIMQASDQNFYGTFLGGTRAAFYGVIYRVTPKGEYTEIHLFNGDGAQPKGPLVEGFDGNLYGVVQKSPDGSPGAFFRVGLDGSFTEVYIPTDPRLLAPSGGLTLGPDGNFYGVSNGINMYQFNPTTNTATVLFTAFNESELANFLPVLGPDGRLYFMNDNPAVCDCPNGSLLSFGLDGSGPEFPFIFGPDGYAEKNLMVAADGNFYDYSPAENASEAERVDVSNQTSTIYSLAGIGGGENGDLAQLSNGQLAGTTYTKGINGQAGGTLFLLNTGAPKPAPSILQFEPQTASPGQTVTLWGSQFIGTTAVSLSGLPATFQVAASGFLSFTVPAGATSSSITVTNAGGTGVSAAVLDVQ
jgi:hypothetical protein